jgi:hypothetical protein
MYPHHSKLYSSIVKIIENLNMKGVKDYFSYYGVILSENSWKKK